MCHQISLSFTGGRAAQLAFQHSPGGAEVPSWGCVAPRTSPSSQIHPHRLRAAAAAPKFNHRIKELRVAPGPPQCAFLGCLFLFFFLLNTKDPFGGHCSAVAAPERLKKHNKKPTLRIPTTAFVHQSSCSQTPNRATNSSAPSCFQPGCEPGGRKEKPTAVMNQCSLFQPPTSRGRIPAH